MQTKKKVKPEKIIDCSIEKHIPIDLSSHATAEYGIYFKFINSDNADKQDEAYEIYELFLIFNYKNILDELRDLLIHIVIILPKNSTAEPQICVL